MQTTWLKAKSTEYASIAIANRWDCKKSNREQKLNAFRRNWIHPHLE